MSRSDDDEKAVRAKLVAMGVGPNGGPTPPGAPSPPSTPPPVPKPPKPVKPPRVIPRPRPKPKSPKPPKAQRPPKAQAAPKAPRPASTHPAWTPAPRQSLVDAWQRIPPRVKWLAYHLAAAAVGWRLGWVRWASDAAAWYAAGHWTSPSAWVLYGLALVLLGAYRRTRTWAWPAAWIAAIPVSSITVGLLLYGTDYTNLRLPW